MLEHLCEVQSETWRDRTRRRRGVQHQEFCNSYAGGAWFRVISSVAACIAALQVGPQLDQFAWMSDALLVVQNCSTGYLLSVYHGLSNHLPATYLAFHLPNNDALNDLPLVSRDEEMVTYGNKLLWVM